MAGLRVWLRDRLAGPAWLAWVAVESGGDHRGHVFLQIIERNGCPTRPIAGHAARLGYLTNCYVEAEYRGPWPRRALLDALRAHAVAIELDAVVVWPMRAQCPALPRVGFQDAATSMLE